MPQYEVEVKEEVTATIKFTIIADSKEEAANQARHQWVTNGEGSPNEAVNERWVEVDGEFIETSEEDE